MRNSAREEDAAPELLAAQLLTPSQEAIGNETAATLASVLAALSEEREVITLSRLVGLPHRVVAELMDRSEVAVRQLLGRALARMGRELAARNVQIDKFN